MYHTLFDFNTQRCIKTSHSNSITYQRSWKKHLDWLNRLFASQYRLKCKMLPRPFPRQKFIVRRRVQIYARTADWNGNRHSSPPGTHLGNLGSKLPVSYFTKNASSVCSLMILLSIFFSALCALITWDKLYPYRKRQHKRTPPPSWFSF